MELAASQQFLSLVKGNACAKLGSPQLFDYWQEERHRHSTRYAAGGLRPRITTGKGARRLLCGFQHHLPC
jgi:hypothetical protein